MCFQGSIYNMISSKYELISFDQLHMHQSVNGNDELFTTIYEMISLLASMIINRWLYL